MNYNETIKKINGLLKDLPGRDKQPYAHSEITLSDEQIAILNKLLTELNNHYNNPVQQLKRINGSDDEQALLLYAIRLHLALMHVNIPTEQQSAYDQLNFDLGFIEDQAEENQDKYPKTFRTKFEAKKSDVETTTTAVEGDEDSTTPTENSSKVPQTIASGGGSKALSKAVTTTSTATEGVDTTIRIEDSSEVSQTIASGGETTLTAVEDDSGQEFDHSHTFKDGSETTPIKHNPMMGAATGVDTNLINIIDHKRLLRDEQKNLDKKKEGFKAIRKAVHNAKITRNNALKTLFESNSMIDAFNIVNKSNSLGKDGYKNLVELREDRQAIKTYLSAQIIDVVKEDLKDVSKDNKGQPVLPALNVPYGEAYLNNDDAADTAVVPKYTIDKNIISRTFTKTEIMNAVKANKAGQGIMIGDVQLGEQIEKNILAFFGEGEIKAIPVAYYDSTHGSYKPLDIDVEKKTKEITTTNESGETSVTIETTNEATHFEETWYNTLLDLIGWTPYRVTTPMNALRYSTLNRIFNTQLDTILADEKNKEDDDLQKMIWAPFEFVGSKYNKYIYGNEKMIAGGFAGLGALVLIGYCFYMMGVALAGVPWAGALALAAGVPIIGWVFIAIAALGVLAYLVSYDLKNNNGYFVRGTFLKDTYDFVMSGRLFAAIGAGLLSTIKAVLYSIPTVVALAVCIIASLFNLLLSPINGISRFVKNYKSQEQLDSIEREINDTGFDFQEKENNAQIYAETNNKPYKSPITLDERKTLQELFKERKDLKTKIASTQGYLKSCEKSLDFGISSTYNFVSTNFQNFYNAIVDLLNKIMGYEADSDKYLPKYEVKDATYLNTVLKEKSQSYGNVVEKLQAKTFYNEKVVGSTYDRVNTEDPDDNNQAESKTWTESILNLFSQKRDDNTTTSEQEGTISPMQLGTDANGASMFAAGGGQATAEGQYQRSNSLGGTNDNVGSDTSEVVGRNSF